MDAYSYYAGNSALLPELSNALELSYSLFDGAITFSGTYSQSANQIQSDSPYRFSDTSRVLYIAPINVPNSRYYAVSLFGSLPIKPWWNVEYYASTFYNELSGYILGGDFSNSAWSYSLQATNAFTIRKGLEFEFGGNYNSNMAWGISQNQGFGALSGALRLNVLKEKATIRLAVQDIFWSELYKSTIDSKWLTFTGKFRSDNRVVQLSFRYRFGSMTVKAPAKSEKDEDLKRMGGR
jgi:hypothetical protein